MKNELVRDAVRSGFFPLLFVSVLWIIFFVELTSNIKLNYLGIAPRRVGGLPGILTSVFVHGNLGHLASNSLPLLVLGMMLFHFYRKIAFYCFAWIWLVSGFWLWIGGRGGGHEPVYHIGASTLIYGLASFLFFSGLFRRHRPLMVVSALVVFLYGSIMWGILPIAEEISWEGHLSGLLAGLLVAFNYRREGPQRQVYQWEYEEDDIQDHSFPENAGLPGEGGEEPIQERNQDLRIVYHFKKRTEQNDKNQ